MIDLHCHLLPGIDDGPADLATTLAMARIAFDDGVRTIACTPHIYPGLYDNSGPDIQRRTRAVQTILAHHGIGIRLTYGADTHLVPDVLTGLRDGRIPTLAGGRYFLLEPSHTVRPPRFVDSVFELIGTGYVPLITHPERLTWIAEHYNDFLQLARSGAWLQVTGGALLGLFGKGPKLFAERLVGDGWCAVLASDAHSTGRRAPVLAAAVERAAQLIGAEEARRLVDARPRAVLANAEPETVPAPPGLVKAERPVRGKIASTLIRWASAGRA